VGTAGYFDSADLPPTAVDLDSCSRSHQPTYDHYRRSTRCPRDQDHRCDQAHTAHGRPVHAEWFPSGTDSGPWPAPGTTVVQVQDGCILRFGWTLQSPASRPGSEQMRFFLLYAGSCALSDCARTISAHPGVTARSVGNGELARRSELPESVPGPRGTDMADCGSMRSRSRGMCPDLPYLPELPARGTLCADLIRTARLPLSLRSGVRPANLLAGGSPMPPSLGASCLAFCYACARTSISLRSMLRDTQAPCQTLGCAGPWTLASMMARPRGGSSGGRLRARRDPSSQSSRRGHRLSAHCPSAGPRRLPDVETAHPATTSPCSLPVIWVARWSTATRLSRHRPIGATRGLSGGLRYIGERLSRRTPVVVPPPPNCCAAGAARRTASAPRALPGSWATSTNCPAPTADAVELPASKRGSGSAWVLANRPSAGAG
jgi:hypothetical protein